MTKPEAIKILEREITPELIETLVLAARVIGWTVNLQEVYSFIQSLQGIAGLPVDSFDEYPSVLYEDDEEGEDDV